MSSHHHPVLFVAAIVLACTGSGQSPLDGANGASGAGGALATAGNSGSGAGRAGVGGSVTSGTGGGGGTGAGGGSGGSGGTGVVLPTDDSGFTVLTPSADSQTIYVSTSGDDANDGLSEDTPVKTVAKGKSLLREGYPDWLLLKRGDVWQEGLGGWRLSGRSPEERMVIGAYGTGERPRLEFMGTGLATSGGESPKESMDNLAFVSLHLLGAAHDLSRGAPTGSNPYCINWLRGATDVLFEDMRFEYCYVNIQAFDGFPAVRMRFFRDLFLDSFALDSAHAQGIYLDGAAETAIEECIFDHCGWHPDVPQATPTIFNHCIYWQKNGPPDALVRNNLLLRASSHGAQLRSSGTLDGNVFAQDAIGGFLGGEWNSPPLTPRQGYARGNLFTEGQDILPRDGHPNGMEYRGWAFELITGIQDVELSDNIVSDCSSATPAMACRSLPQMYGTSLVENNIVWDWPSTQGNDQQPGGGPFVDPERTIATYNASLGGAETFDAFAQEARRQSKTNWRAAYTAQSVIQYFREGFALQ